MSTNEGEKILAPGVMLRLNDGTEVNLRYGYRQLYELEKQFGGIQNVFDGLQEGFKGDLFGTLLPALAIGSGIPLEELLDKLDPADMEQHSEAFGRALQQAFPRQTQEQPTSQGKTTETTELTGATLTTLPRDDTAAPIPHFG